MRYGTTKKSVCGPTASKPFGFLSHAHCLSQGGARPCSRDGDVPLSARGGQSSASWPANAARHFRDVGAGVGLCLTK